MKRSSLRFVPIVAHLQEVGMLATGRLGPHTVSRIGFGAMQLVSEARTHPTAAVSHDAAVSVVRRAVELGVTHLDTAEFYGAGATNPLLREALSPWPADVVVATKVGAVHNGTGLVAAQQPAQLREQVHANLRSLGVDRLGVVNLRRVDEPPGIVADGEQLVDLDDQLAELISLRDAGLIDAIGVSSVSADQVRQALPAGIACVQNLYNVLERDADPLVELCADSGVAWVPFFPIGSGFAGRARAVDDQTVRDVARQLGTTPHAVCLAWLLARGEHVLLIPGTGDVAHVQANIAVGALSLPSEAVRRLDALRG